QRRYMIDEIMADIASGHTIVSTVFIEHLSFFRAEGPDAMKYVGEVEFANGMAAMAASGLYGKTHVSAGIIGYADMRMGVRVREVLEAELRAAPDRLKGIRCTGAWDPDPRIARVDRPGLYSDATFREGIAQCAPLGLSFDVTARLTQLPEVADMARQLPGYDLHPQSYRRCAGHRRLCRPARRDLWHLAQPSRRDCQMPQRRNQARRLRHGVLRLWLARASKAANEPGA